MQSPSSFEVKQPDGMSVEGWLSQMDSRPTAVPRWPESRRMALVAAINEDMDTEDEKDARGFVLVRQGQADKLCDFTNCLTHTGILFFRVPRQWLLDSGAVPGLTPLDWD